MKPRIGMIIRRSATEDRFSIGQNDIYSIVNAGGMPVLIPSYDNNDDIDAQLDGIDALYVPGGADVSPLVYGEEPIEEQGASRRSNDIFESEIIRRAAARKLPVLGICRGAQIVNVAFGGTLYQDIKSQYVGAIRHRQADKNCELTHTVTVLENTTLAEICGTGKLQVNSFHHQAVKVPGNGLRVSATASDGMIECVESEDGLVLGIQWHPETLQQHGGAHTAVFKWFVEKASK